MGNGSPVLSCLSQLRPLISSRLLVSKWPFEATTNQPPLQNEINLHNSTDLASSHSLIVLSGLDVNTNRPSGEKTADFTASEWPTNCPTSLPVATSHIFAVLSSLPVIKYLPSRENARVKIQCLWPTKFLTFFP